MPNTVVIIPPRATHRPSGSRVHKFPRPHLRERYSAAFANPQYAYSNAVHFEGIYPTALVVLVAFTRSYTERTLKYSDMQTPNLVGSECMSTFEVAPRNLDAMARLEEHTITNIELETTDSNQGERPGNGRSVQSVQSVRPSAVQPTRYQRLFRSNVPYRVL